MPHPVTATSAANASGRIAAPPQNNEARARTAVRVTLAVVVTALLFAVAAVPRTQRSRAVVESQRLCVEVGLTLAELRATIAEYHTAHGTFPGGGPSRHSDPFWLEHQLELAFRRANGHPTAAAFDLPTPRSPRIEGAVLPNPLNQRSNVRFLAPDEPWPLAGDDTTGWLYRPATGEIRANSPGKSAWSGERFMDM